VGAGTFKPVSSDTIGEHDMHTEHFFVSRELLESLINCKGKLIAVGTTSVRTLESLYWMGVKLLLKKDSPFIISQWETYDIKEKFDVKDVIKAILDHLNNNNLQFLQAATQIIILPGYDFKLVKGLVTNFHQPASTLLLLIAALIGDKWKEVYDYALSNNFRFLSYGDSSLLIP